MELRKILNQDGIESVIAEQLLDMDHDALSEEAKKGLLREQLKRTRQPNLSFSQRRNLKPWPYSMSLGRMASHPFITTACDRPLRNGFIHDVLAHCTCYKRYYKLIQNIEQDPEVPRRKARALARFVEFHHY